MLTTILTAFVASVLGSVHCAAMCGGLVSYTSGTSRRPVFEQAGYHLARVLAYVTLGAIAGHLGHALNSSALVLGWQNAAAWVAGTSMVTWALVQLWPLAARHKDVELVALTVQPKPSKLSRWFMWLHRLPSGTRGVLLGMTTALLPCGWLYAFVATAAGQGSAWSGAALMAGFALGSVPMLVGVGGLARRASQAVRRVMPQLSAIVLLLLGLTTLFLRAPSSAAASAASQKPPTAHSCH